MKKYIKSLFICLFFALISRNNISAGTFPRLTFKQFSTVDGLSNRRINSISEDNNGSLLIGTFDGLNRLDGYRVKQFFYDPRNPNSIPDNVVLNSIQTSQYLHWFSTQTGIFIYNSQKREVERPTILRKTSLTNEYGTTFFSNKGLLYFFGAQNYFIKHKNQLTKHRYTNKKANDGKLDFRYVGLIKTKKGLIFGFSGTSFLQLNSGNLEIEQQRKIGDKNNLGITSIIENNGKIWITTWGNGVFVYDIKQQQIQQVQLKDKIIHCLKSVNIEGKAYVIAGTFLGYVIIDPATFAFEEVDLKTEVWAIHLDKKKRLWLGTSNGLMYTLNTQESSIKTHAIIQESSKSKYFQFDQLIAGFYATKKYNYAPLIYGNGILVYSKKWEFIRYIPSISTNETSIAFRDIRCIYEKGNYLWVTTDAGLSKCDLNLQLIEQFSPINNLNPAGDLNRMRKIIPYKNDQLIIQGLNSVVLFNLKTEKFTRIFDLNNRKNSLISEQLIVGSYCSGTDLFLAFEHDLTCLNVTTGTTKKIAFPLYKKRLTCINKTQSTLWIGTQTGLYSFDLKTKKTTGYFRENGFVSDHILESVTDKQQNIWLTTINGIAFFNTKSKKIKIISTADGLMDNLVDGGLFIDEKNNIIAASVNTFYVIQPSIIHLLDKGKKSIITEIIQQSKKCNWKNEHHKKYIEFDNHSNSFNVHFTVPTYVLNENQDYWYRVNSKWFKQKTGLISFNNLPDGDYEIVVGDAKMNSPLFDSITIRILPPFYKTWWFLFLLSIITLLLLFLFWKIRLNKYKKELALQHSFQHKIKTSEMNMLRAQMNPHFIFNSLNAINFYIISNEKTLASNYLTMFSKLIRNILENSKNTTISLKSELDTLKLYLKLEAARLDQKFDFIIQTTLDSDLDLIKLPPLIIQPFVENSIWHGIQQKEGLGMIEIYVDQLNDNELCIRIIDNGIGRKAANNKANFEKAHKSYGIAITKERLKLLNPLNNVIVTDLYNETQEANGTKVELHIYFDE